MKNSNSIASDKATAQVWVGDSYAEASYKREQRHSFGVAVTFPNTPEIIMVVRA